MKQRFVRFICLALLCLCIISQISAQAIQTRWHGKISIGERPALMNGDMILEADGELHTGGGKLSITGGYRGETGSRIFHDVTIETGDISRFMDISGSAEGSTEIIPAMDARRDGLPVDLIRAKKDGSDAAVFHIKPVMPDCGDCYVQLKHKTAGDYSFWSVMGTKTLPLIKQLSSHTLLVNNNASTNGGHSFSYYRWYRDGQLLKENAHSEYGGSYYTGENALDADATYSVEATGTDGNLYFSCPYRYIPQALAVGVTVYPNPVPRYTQANIRVETVDLSLLKDASVEIYDMLGRLVGKTALNGQTLTTVNFPPKQGIYLLKFRAKDNIEDIKVTVE